jgi:hypothetical protein
MMVGSCALQLSAFQPRRRWVALPSPLTFVAGTFIDDAIGIYKLQGNGEMPNTHLDNPTHESRNTPRLATALRAHQQSQRAFANGL